MQLAVTGITGLRNRGVDALVRSTVAGLEDERPDTRIAVFTNSPDYDRAALVDPRVEFRKAGFGGIREARRAARLPGYDRLAALVRPKFRDTARALRTSDVVIASGGDVFSSDYGDMVRHLRPLRMAQAAGIPVVFLAHSIGVFRSKAEARDWLEVARKARLITVRESASYEYVTTVLGLPAERVALTADVAFLLPPTGQAAVERMLATIDVEPATPMIAVCPSNGISRFAAQDAEAHQRAWAALFDRLLEVTPATIVMVPHVQEVKQAHDDRQICERLLDRFRHSSRVRMIAGDYNASDFKGLIARADLVIAERMHAAIAGLSSGRATIVIAYSIKGHGIMRDLFGPRVQDQGHVIPVDAFIDRASDIGGLIKAQWQQREATQARLTRVLPQMMDRARENFARLDRVVAAS